MNVDDPKPHVEWGQGPELLIQKTRIVLYRNSDKLIHTTLFLFNLMYIWVFTVIGICVGIIYAHKLQCGWMFPGDVELVYIKTSLPGSKVYKCVVY